jgi:TPR repeat protein
VQAGNTRAAVALADLYLRGDGVPVNCDQARVLLVVASKENNAEAIKKLQDLDETGCPAP